VKIINTTPKLTFTPTTIKLPEITKEEIKEEINKNEIKKEEINKEDIKKEELNREERKEEIKKEITKEPEIKVPLQQNRESTKPHKNSPEKLPENSSETVREWAWDLMGVSSEAGYEPGDDWGSRQILGAPTVTAYGDSGNAWAPLETNAGHEWIAVKFRRRLFISEVLILESWHPGAIFKVEALNPDGKWDPIGETVAAPQP